MKVKCVIATLLLIIGVISIFVCMILINKKVIQTHFDEDILRVFNKISIGCIITFLLVCVFTFLNYLINTTTSNSALIKASTKIIDFVTKKNTSIISILFSVTLISINCHILLWILSVMVGLIMAIFYW